MTHYLQVLSAFLRQEYAPGNVILSLSGCGSVNEWPCTGQGTPELCFSRRPWASESLNCSESMFLLLRSHWNVTIALCFATVSRLLNDFRYHSVPLICSSKYVYNIYFIPKILIHRGILGVPKWSISCKTLCQENWMFHNFM